MSTGKADATASEIDAMLNRFEQSIDSLKQSYEKYFNGIDRRPPTQERKAVVRQLRQLKHKTFIRNTAQKFRLRSLNQRFNTYKNYWDRVLRQIENGTYRRDRLKAKRNVERKKKQEQAREEVERLEEQLQLDMELDAIDDLDAFAAELEREMDQITRKTPRPNELDEGSGAQPQAAPASAPPQQRSRPQQQRQPRQPQPSQPQPSPPQRASQPSAPAQPAGAQASAGAGFAGGDEQQARTKKIRELQAKLGLPTTGTISREEQERTQASPPERAPTLPNQPRPNSQPSRPQQRPTQQRPTSTPNPQGNTGGGDDDRRRKLEAMRQRLQQRTRGETMRSGSEQAGVADSRQPPTRGANAEKLKRLRADKERLEKLRQRQRQRRTIERSGGGGEDDHVRRVYRNLIEAKKRCNEATDRLTYESVARSMKKQRERLRQRHGARDVDFKVVIKDGRAFLKPEPK